MNLRSSLQSFAAARVVGGVPGRVIAFLLIAIFVLGPHAGAIPVQAAPVSQGGIQRIRFAPGATSAIVSGTLSSGQSARYVLTALAGQSMNVQVYSNGAPIFVTVFDTSRAVLGSAISGEGWTGRLPATGDYLLAVYPSPYGAGVGYELRVEITSGSQTPVPEPERIRFATGAVSAQVTGFLPTGTSKAYVLGARSGQVMTVESWTNSGPFRFSITSANGALLGSGSQGERWSGTLPATEDYRITLQSASGSQAAHYGLVVTIVNAAPAPTATPAPPAAVERIRFPRGATSVTLTGYVDSYTPARYVLRALRGQTMNVFLNSVYGSNITVTVRDGQGNSLGSASRGEQWSGYLPSTGDYYLDVLAPRENVSELFSLWIEIR
jgi:hypothetical protein